VETGLASRKVAEDEILFLVNTENKGREAVQTLLSALKSDEFLSR